jgi:hypothetical protein
MTTTGSRVAASLALVTACIVLMAGLEVASAHKFNAKTTVKITDGGPDGAEGKVGSRRAACKPSRKVKLYREKSGRDDLIGWSFTNDAGRWELASDLKEGDYYAVVTRRREGSGAHEHICGRATSVKVHF